MKVVITTVHEIEAESWDKAVETYLQEPLQHLTDCRVKAPGQRLLHIAPGNLWETAIRLSEIAP